MNMRREGMCEGFRGNVDSVTSRACCLGSFVGQGMTTTEKKRLFESTLDKVSRQQSGEEIRTQVTTKKSGEVGILGTSWEPPMEGTVLKRIQLTMGRLSQTRTGRLTRTRDSCR